MNIPNSLRPVVLGLIVLGALSLPAAAEAKRALVIGNAAYAVGPLKNPTNDATDMAASLRSIGFEVKALTNAGLADMRDAVDEFGASLAPDDIGLFYYSGHGIQIDGRNYLVPVDMKVTAASQVRNRALAADEVLAAMQGARNKANVIILDACRDNPFPVASKDLRRGLVAVGSQPPDSIILYATSAESTASDGEGRNGLFTQALLKNLAAKDTLENVVNRTAQEVRTQSGGKQIPAKYSQLFKDVYLAGEPEKKLTGTLIVTSGKAATVSVNGQAPLALKAGVPQAVTVTAGAWRAEVAADGKKESYSGTLKADEQAAVGAFAQAPAPTPSPVVNPAGPGQTAPALTADDLRQSLVTIPGGKLTWYNFPSVLETYQIAAYEVTQAQWKAVMGTTPSFFEGDLRPVEQVSFVEAAEFCNRLSALQGYAPAYTITGDRVNWNFGSDGYRLPTAAEWCWAATSAGTETKKFPGSNSPNEAGWFKDNASGETHPVGQKKPNGSGLYDTFGNVAEWVWDKANGYYANPIDLSRAVNLEPGQDGKNPAGPGFSPFPAPILMGISWGTPNTGWNPASGKTMRNVSQTSGSFLGFRICRGARPADATVDRKTQEENQQRIRTLFQGFFPNAASLRSEYLSSVYDEKGNYVSHDSLVTTVLGWRDVPGAWEVLCGKIDNIGKIEVLRFANGSKTSRKVLEIMNDSIQKQANSPKALSDVRRISGTLMAWNFRKGDLLFLNQWTGSENDILYFANLDRGEVRFLSLKHKSASSSDFFVDPSGRYVLFHYRYIDLFEKPYWVFDLQEAKEVSWLPDLSKAQVGWAGDATLVVNDKYYDLGTRKWVPRPPAPDQAADSFNKPVKDLDVREANTVLTATNRSTGRVEFVVPLDLPVEFLNAISPNPKLKVEN